MNQILFKVTITIKKKYKYDLYYDKKEERPEWS